ncbi:MAG: chemotaxis protein CheA [Desulfobacterota bacterium]|nr:chemotaxis protein CheA [Thermodesulfobacteriota bacterium]
MMLDESLQREGCFEILSKTITSMQQRTRSGTDPHEYPFPRKLFNNQNQQEEQKKRDTYILPAHIDENIFIDFLNDQEAILERLDANLLAIEKEFNAEAVNDVRRIFHTLKGEAAIFELTDIHRICHMTEDLLDKATPPLPIDGLLQISDWLKSSFAYLREQRKLLEIPETINAIFENTKIHHISDAKITSQYAVSTITDINDAVIINRATTQPPEVTVPQQMISGDVDLLSDFVSEVQEHIESIDTKLLSLEKTPQNVDLLNAIFRVFHTIKGAAGFLGLDDITRLAHTTENLLDLARKGEMVFSADTIDVIFSAVDEMKKLIKEIEKTIAKGLLTYTRSDTLNIVINRIQALTNKKDAIDDKRHLVLQPLVVRTESQEALEREAENEARLSIQDAIRATQDSFVTLSQAQKGKIKEPIKVDSENLDKLIDAIGELVIIESMIKQDNDLKRYASPKLQRTITQMDKITRELQQLGMSLRMIPVKGTFQKMARVVRDLAKKSGKNIEFITRGENTMLDKSVVDRIGDPLIHLVRNAVDHGIESNPENRIMNGKPPHGTIELTAFHKGGNIYIEIKDDGKGLSKNLILEKAKQRGLLRENQTLSDREIFNFIFLPGFSTAQQVTDVSGRGVGMDVVKRAIEDLRGNIDIQSEEGKGTIFSLRLPLTLAIIDGMLVRIGDERYIIPTLSIVEAIRPKSSDLVTVVNRGEMIKIRDRLIPLFRLSHLFDIKNAEQDPTRGIIIVVEDSGKITGLLVDELLGQQSTVIKSLGAYMKGLTGISGGSIMSDGKVGIIIDVAGIIKLATAHYETQQKHISLTS